MRVHVLNSNNNSEKLKASGTAGSGAQVIENVLFVSLHCLLSLPPPPEKLSPQSVHFCPSRLHGHEKLSSAASWHGLDCVL